MAGTRHIGCLACNTPIGTISYVTHKEGQFIFFCTPCWERIQNRTPEEAIDGLLDMINDNKEKDGSPWHI